MCEEKMKENKGNISEKVEETKKVESNNESEGIHKNYTDIQVFFLPQK